MDELNEITITRRGNIWHAQDTLYGSTTTTSTLTDALLWAVNSGTPIILRVVHLSTPPKGWLTETMERAEQRIAETPNRARPKLVDRSDGPDCRWCNKPPGADCRC